MQESSSSTEHSSSASSVPGPGHRLTAERVAQPQSNLPPLAVARVLSLPHSRRDARPVLARASVPRTSGFRAQTPPPVRGLTQIPGARPVVVTYQVVAAYRRASGCVAVSATCACARAIGTDADVPDGRASLRYTNSGRARRLYPRRGVAQQRSKPLHSSLPSNQRAVSRHEPTEPRAIAVHVDQR